jgi:hypothetical protein
MCLHNTLFFVCTRNLRLAACYLVGSESFRLDIQKPRQMERELAYFLKGTELLVHRCEKYVEIRGVCIKKWQSCFISVTLKSWSGRKLFDPSTQLLSVSRRTDSYSAVCTCTCNSVWLMVFCICTYSGRTLCGLVSGIRPNICALLGKTPTNPATKQLQTYTVECTATVIGVMGT